MRFRGASEPVGRSVWIVVASLVLVLCGCSKFQVPLLFGGHSHMEVEVSADLNQNSPLALDLLVVYDQKLLESLEKKTATEWFKNRAQFLKDKKKLKSHHWEWVPGQPGLKVRFNFKRNARGGLIFANYQSAGDHRARFNPHRHLRISLEEKDFTLVQ